MLFFYQVINKRTKQLLTIRQALEGSLDDTDGDIFLRLPYSANYLGQAKVLIQLTREYVIENKYKIRTNDINYIVNFYDEYVNLAHLLQGYMYSNDYDIHYPHYADIFSFYCHKTDEKLSNEVFDILNKYKRKEKKELQKSFRKPPNVFDMLIRKYVIKEEDLQGRSIQQSIDMGKR